MASLGITAEAGGTSFNKTLSMMQMSVETNSSKLAKFAKVAGMSASEFKKAFKNDASGTLLEFTKGLGNTERNGKSTIAVLDDLGITGSEQTLMLTKLAGGTKTVSDSLKVGSKAWKENNALQNEAKQRYGTTESSIKMMKNQIDNASITIGTAFLPAIRDASQFLANIADKFNNLSPSTRKVIVTIGLITLGIGVLLLVGGGLLIFVANVMGAFTALAGAGVILGGVVTFLGTVIGFLCSPIGLVVGAILLLQLAWSTNFLGIRDITTNVMNWIKTQLNSGKGVLGSLGQMAKDFGNWWKEMADKVNKNPIVATVKKIFTGGDTSTTKSTKTRKAFGGTITKNDTLARLHQGEKVLTKGEANRMNDSKGQGIVINMNGVTIREEADVKRIAKSLVRELKNQQVTFTGGY
jgi:hypothetical protein